MKSIGLALGGILIIAVFTRKFDARARALLFAGLVVMTIVLAR